MPLAELPIPGTPVRELVVRGIIISCALTIAFRPAGRREFGQLGALDLPLVVSGAGDLARAERERRLAQAGLIVLSTLFVVDCAVGLPQFRSPAPEKVTRVRRRC